MAAVVAPGSDASAHLQLVLARVHAWRRGRRALLAEASLVALSHRRVRAPHRFGWCRVATHAAAVCRRPGRARYRRWQARYAIADERGRRDESARARDQRYGG